MAHLPLSQSERALCFVPAAKQFERARELRAKLYAPDRAAPRPVLVGTRPVLIETSVKIQPPVKQEKPALTTKRGARGYFNQFIVETKFEGRTLYHLDFQKISTLPEMIEAMEYFTRKTGERPIRSGLDVARFVRMIEAHVCLEPGALNIRRRTPFYMIPRRFYCQQMKLYSAMSLPSIGRAFKLDHTTVLHHIRCEIIGLDNAYMRAVDRNEYRSQLKVFYGDKWKVPNGSPPKPWTDYEDSIISDMVKTGLTIADMAVLFDGFRSSNSVAKRVSVLRSRGKL